MPNLVFLTVNAWQAATITLIAIYHYLSHIMLHQWPCNAWLEKDEASSCDWPYNRDERSHIFQTPTPLLLHALRLLLRLRKFLKHQLRLLLTLRKLRSNSCWKDTVFCLTRQNVVAILPLIKHKWLIWSRDKHNTERHNMLRFKVMA